MGLNLFRGMLPWQRARLRRLQLEMQASISPICMCYHIYVIIYKFSYAHFRFKSAHLDIDNLGGGGMISYLPSLPDQGVVLVNGRVHSLGQNIQ